MDPFLFDQLRIATDSARILHNIRRCHGFEPMTVEKFIYLIPSNTKRPKDSHCTFSCTMSLIRQVQLELCIRTRSQSGPSWRTSSRGARRTPSKCSRAAVSRPTLPLLLWHHQALSLVLHLHSRQAAETLEYSST